MRVDYLPNLLEDVALPHHAVNEIRAIKRTDELLGVTQSQLLDDVVAHLLCCGRGVGMNARLGKPRSQLLQHPVLGPKVVAPRADAVGFVDREERDVGVVEERQHLLGAQPFGRDV